jgi:hypothetical protein
MRRACVFLGVPASSAGPTGRSGATARIPEPERETGAILPALALTSGVYQPA